MNYTDEQLQAAIDAAFPAGYQPYSRGLEVSSFRLPGAWKDESPNRLAIARAFLAELGEIKPADVDPYARLKAYAKAGARIRLDGEYVRSDWTLDKEFPFRLSPEKYEVHPDDLHLCPESAPQYPDPVSSWSKVDEEVHPDAPENWNQCAEKPAWNGKLPSAGATPTSSQSQSQTAGLPR